MVFQDPFASLNPTMNVYEIISEPWVIHSDFLDKKLFFERVSELLISVGLHPNDSRRYPHQFSGGQRQRVMIAMALALEPDIIIADEPTTALDVSVQAQILDLLKNLCKERGTSIILVTHDMGVIAQTTDRVGVLYAGRLAEIGDTREVLTNPKHPYTKGLVDSTPRIDANSFYKELYQISGTMPKLDAMPNGCAFHPRCEFAIDKCSKETPQVFSDRAACWLLENEAIVE